MIEFNALVFSKKRGLILCLMLLSASFALLRFSLVPTISASGLTKTYYPSWFYSLYPTLYVDGSISDLQNDDDVSMQFRSGPTGPTTRTIFAHGESINIGGTNYFSLKVESADTTGINLNVPAFTSTRFLFGRFVYSLSGVTYIQPSGWSFVYRAKADYGIGAHVDVDIKVLTSYGAVRQWIAVHVADSPSLPTSWASLNGGFYFPGYTVVNQTDYLSIEYYAHITTPYTSGYVYLDIDDSSLPPGSQTCINNVALPQDQIVTVMFMGQSNTKVWTELIWTIDSAWGAPQVQVTFQLYNFTSETWSASGDGYISYTSNGVPYTYETKNQTVTGNPTSFRDASGNWKILITGKKVATSFTFIWFADFMQFQVRVRGFTVPDDFSTIQAAINAAQTGDVIFVKAGTYYENVVVNKTLTLEGEDAENTIIDGGGVGTVVTVSVNNVSVQGFTIRNSGRSWPNAGLTLYSARYITITGNRITNNGDGIHMRPNSNYNIVSGNNITNNRRGVYLYSSSSNSVSGNNITNNSYGVELSYSSNYNSVSGNNITANYYGIYLSSDNNSIVGNNIANNTHHGIRVASGNNTISKNKVTGNGIIGIGLETVTLPSGVAKFNTVSDNNVTGNGYSDPYGVGILIGGPFWNRVYGESWGNVLSGNIIADNRYNFDLWGRNLQSFVNYVDTSNTVDGKPIYYWINETDKTVPLDAGYVALVNCTRIKVENLNLTRNGQGILLASTINSTIAKNNVTNNYDGIVVYESLNNLIYYNNFIDNVNQIHDCSWDIPEVVHSVNIWDNGYPSGGNYWSGYTGVDWLSGPYQNETGSDGIGDIPYSIDENNIDSYPLMNPTNGSRPPPTSYRLTIKTTIGGTTNPVPGTYVYSRGQTVLVQAIPDNIVYYRFDHWELNGINIGSTNPTNVTMDKSCMLLSVFVQIAYDVTIKAYCVTEGVDISVPIIMDGNPTGYTTPHTFIVPKGTHTFTVPNADSHCHPLKQWNTGETNTTIIITVTATGTYTAYYGGETVIRVGPQNITVSRGQFFTVAIVIENVLSLYAFQIQIKWNTTYLEYISHTLTVPVESYPAPIAPSPYPGLLHGPTINSGPVVDQVAGTFFIAAVSLNQAPVFNGNGTALIITFKALNQTGITSLNFAEETLLLNSELQYIPYVSMDGVVEVLPSYVFYDIAIINVMSPKSVVGQGYPVDINVTVKNYGNFTETFDVTLYADSGTPTNETGLVGYWNFDEGTGTTAYDSSGNNNHGTIYGATWTSGKYGNALQFDGIDDSVEVPHSNSLDLTNIGTIAAWIKISSSGPAWQGNIVNKAGGWDRRGWMLTTLEYNRIRFHWQAGSDRVLDSQTMLSYDQWHYVVAVMDGTMMKIYIDGVQDPNTLLNDESADTTAPITIGRADYFGYLPFNGIIDEVKIYNRVLSAEEVWAEYTRAIGKFVIGTQTVTLESGASTTLTFTWNATGFAKGNYTIWAYAEPVPGEADIADNTFTNGIVYVGIPGDIAEPLGVVDGKDIAFVCRNFGRTPESQGYNPNTDINNDGIVDGKDIAITCRNFGKTDP